MVPIRVEFEEGMELRMKEVIPVLIDRANKLITFAVATPVSELLASPRDRIENGEFSLSDAAMEMKCSGKDLEIQLK
jgi:hypothetical protein